MDRKKYHVNIGTGEISQIKYSNNENFVIHATNEEVGLLRAKMDKMGDADIRTFYRSHVPIMPYHHDKSNDDYDDAMTEAFQMIYNLGDPGTKSHIDEIGILGKNPL